MRTAAFFLLAAVTATAVVFTGATTTAAPVPKHLMKEGDNTEQGKLQGKWKSESIRFGGAEIGAGQAGLELTLEIRGDTLTAVAQNQTTTGKIKLDVADGVKRMAMSNGQRVDRDGKPLGKEDDVTFGYIIDGDKLTLAVDVMTKGMGKPTDPAKPGTNAMVIVFTRVKDKN